VEAHRESRILVCRILGQPAAAQPLESLAFGEEVLPVGTLDRSFPQVIRIIMAASFSTLHFGLRLLTLRGRLPVLIVVATAT